MKRTFKRWAASSGSCALLLSAPVALVAQGALDDALIHRWTFVSTNISGAVARDSKGGLDGTIQGLITLAPGAESLALDGARNSVLLSSALDPQTLPRKGLTVEAWVLMRSPGEWPGIASCVQDNGSFERGWWLGAHDSKFLFALAADTTLTYLYAPSPFELDRWRHVVGSYNGASMRVYLDGQPVASSSAENGDINYASAPFVLGAYQDDNEFYGMEGFLREVSIYDRALSAAEVLARYDEQKELFPEVVPPGPPASAFWPALGPMVRFSGISDAEVIWQTSAPQASIVNWGETAGLGARIEDPVPRTNHRVPLAGLAPAKTYFYSIELRINGEAAASDVHEFETEYNYTVIPIRGASPFPVDEDSHAQIAQAILDQTGVRQGYALDFGCADGRLAYELARHSDLQVMVVSPDASVVDAARRALQAAGVYGSRVSVLRSSLDSLPYTKDWFNLIVSSGLFAESRLPPDARELWRVLRPSGGVALLGLPRGLPTGTPGSLHEWSAVDAWVRSGAPTNGVIQSDSGRSTLARRGALAGAGQWSHNFGDPGQTTSSGDERVLGRSMKVQWFGDPGPRGFTDRQARNPTPLMVNGILYVQGNDRVLAQDAYNGRVCWSLEIPGLRRVNMPRDGGNWCADDGSLYLTHRDKLWRLGATNGELIRSYAAPGAATNHDWGYVANVGERVYGSSVHRGAFYTKYNGSWEFWYDSTSALNEIAKICSDQLFCLDKNDGTLLWRRTNGIVINTTIAIGDGRIYFVDCRNPSIRDYPSGRVEDNGLWQNNWIVALNAATGALLWEQPLAVPASPYPIVFYLCYADGKLVLLDSTTQYHVSCYSADTGSPLWTQGHPWNRNHHGGHMYHPVILSGMVLVEPYAYDLATGAVVHNNLPERGGCSTMSAAARTVHYINWDYSIGSPYFWDLDTDQRRQVAGTRSSCWLSVISGGGLIMMPAASSGCACRFPIQSSITFAAP